MAAGAWKRFAASAALPGFAVAARCDAAGYRTVDLDRTVSAGTVFFGAAVAAAVRSTGEAAPPVLDLGVTVELGCGDDGVAADATFAIGAGAADVTGAAEVVAADVAALECAGVADATAGTLLEEPQPVASRSTLATSAAGPAR